MLVRFSCSYHKDTMFNWIVAILKARSHDQISRIRFWLVPKVGSCEHSQNDLPTHGSVNNDKFQHNLETARLNTCVQFSELRIGSLKSHRVNGPSNRFYNFILSKIVGLSSPTTFPQKNSRKLYTRFYLRWQADFSGVRLYLRWQADFLGVRFC